MIAFFVGVFVGWLITNIARGFQETRKYHFSEDGIYKHIAGPHEPRCDHLLWPKPKGNTIDAARCRQCKGCFISLHEEQRTQYE